MGSKSLYAKAIFLSIVMLADIGYAKARPNVVLIVCDDLNDYAIGGHPQARTPNIDRLARSGVSFRHAYSNNPICAPSRSSFLTGIYPHTSGNLFWAKWFENPVLKNSKTLMEHFRDNGYHTAGSGKLMHHFRRETWNEYPHRADYGPFPFDGKNRVGHPSVPMPFRSIGPVDGSYGPLSDVPFADDNDPTSGWIYGTWGKTIPMRYKTADDRDPTPDERNAAWAAGRIHKFAEQKDAMPFFLAVGFIRPHTPLHVPKKYFDMYPLDTIEMPVIKPGDAGDTHFAKLIPADSKGPRYFRMLGESYPDVETAVKTFTQAYLACVTAVDDCIGQVVDAVDKSPMRDNTIIILTSDHGWTMGQKDFLFKNSPWEESTRIPFIVRAPGVAKPGGVANQPISLIDLYPTLVDLCDLKGDTRKNNQGAKLDGHSIRPLLEDPAGGKWTGPDAALSIVFVGNAAVGKLADGKRKLTNKDIWKLENQHWTLRTKDWRYVRYQNGAEELYDHRNDPHEWNNLANDLAAAKQLKQMRKQLEARIPALAD